MTDQPKPQREPAMHVIPGTFRNTPGGRDGKDLSEDFQQALHSALERNLPTWEKIAAGKASTKDYAKFGQEISTVLQPWKAAQDAAIVVAETTFPDPKKVDPHRQEAPAIHTKIANKLQDVLK